ncbi:hypothetical protein EVAR_91899_1 [Eumeta japonica]|uniref:Uncharacterized protein n=1 Tax=Eumeta variegata TaxID=151549 RepID=A0A4C1T0K8_EUMVA|nr:hypothetical protein EVAR_91899_1 [Eumeta japonica]
MVMMVVAMVVNDRYREASGTAANRCTDRMWRSCVEYSKCMAMPLDYNVCSSYVQADAPSMNCTGIGESVADFSKPLTHGKKQPRGSNQSRHENNRRGSQVRLPRALNTRC